MNGEIHDGNAHYEDQTISSEAFYKAHTELLEMIVEEKPLAEIFDKTTRLIESLSPPETCCTLKIVEKNTSSLNLVCAPSLSPDLVSDLKLLDVRPEDGTCGQAVTLKRTVFSRDIANDPDTSVYWDLARKYGVKSCWSVPVLDKAGEPLAVITFFYGVHHKPSDSMIGQLETMCHLLRLAIERHETSEDLIQSNEKFKSAAAATNDAIWDWDIINDTLWWNDGFSKLFGFEGQGKGPGVQGWLERVHPEDSERVWKSLEAATSGTEKHWVSEYRFLCDNGEMANVLDQAEVIFNFEGKAIRMIGGMSDRTIHWKNEYKLRALNRALEVLRSCDRTLIRATEENQLLKDICTVATEVGGYQMAWVGFAGEGEDKPIIPVASTGDEEGYTKTIRLSYSESEPSGMGPGGRTIRSGKPVICEDIRKESSEFQWKQKALERGFRSLVCLPLNEGTHCFGFISLLSETVNAVSEDELGLLSELSDNVAFGICALRNAIKQKITQDTIVRVAKAVSDSTGKQFYQLLTENMVSALGASAGLIGKIDSDADSLTTLAFMLDGSRQENVTYSLKGTPCSEVTSKRVCIFEENLPALFPDDHYLIELGI